MKSFRALLIFVGFAVHPVCAWPITDCSKPKSPIEMLLCSNDRLSAAETLMALAFRDAFYRTEDKEKLREDQERWTRTVRDVCNDVPCLLKAYRDRTDELQTW
jgi:uncharacterized protein